MAVALTWSSLSDSEKRELQRRYKLRTTPTPFQPKVTTFTVHEIKEEDDEVYVPMMAWQTYFSEFPTKAKEDYPLRLKRLPLNNTLYTPDTDPEKRGRDQQRVVDEATRQLKEYHSTFISASPGYGKCLGKGTLVLTFDRGPIPVEEIRVGDYLLSDEEKLTQVISTTSGYETMVSVEVAPYEHFICNMSHMLTLYKVDHPHHTSLQQKWDPSRCIDISVRDYVKLPTTEKSCMKSVFKSNVELPLVPNATHLYFDSVQEAVDTIYHELKLVGYSDWLTHLRFFPWAFRDEIFWLLIFRISIPHKTNYYITHSNTETIYQLLLLARSLGYMAFYFQSKHSITIRSCKRPYHFAFSPTIQRVDQTTYYGFTLYPHERFLLDSYLITHNTRMGVHLAIQHQLPTAIICHLDIVRTQWVDTIEKLTNGQARIQSVQGHAPIDPKADFYTIGVEKASRLNRDDLEHIGTVIVDEAHLCTLKTFTRTLLKFQPLYLIGLSATPDRPDGLHSVFNFYFHVPSFIIKNEMKPMTVIKIKTHFKPKIEYTMVRGKSVRNWSLMMQSLEENPERWQLVYDLVKKYSDHKILILSHRKSQTQGIFNLVSQTESASILMGTQKHHDKTKRVTCCGMKKGGVGMDDPSLTMAILMSDCKDIRQYVGRIRQSNGIILDIVDDDYSLEYHWRLRRQYYEEQGATIQGDDRVMSQRQVTRKLLD